MGSEMCIRDRKIGDGGNTVLVNRVVEDTFHPTKKGTELPVAPLCPVCDCKMNFRAARKGGFFYGCSHWPNCPGYRNPYGKNPGPKKVIQEQRALYGTDWSAMDQMKIQGKIPFE